MAAAVFYLNDPAAPKPNRPAHLGVNILLEWDGKLLLERRRDCGMWGLPGGGVKGREPERRAMVRELWEETGIRLPESALQKVAVYGAGTHCHLSRRQCLAYGGNSVPGKAGPGAAPSHQCRIQGAPLLYPAGAGGAAGDLYPSGHGGPVLSGLFTDP